MKPIEFSPKLLEKLRTLRRQDKKIFERIEKQLSLFQKDPNYNSLRLHKLKGNLKNVWSISVDKNHRMLYIDEDDTAYFFNIGTHEEVYKK